MSCYIQKLEQVKDGWHSRFVGSSDHFWTMLSNFKAEQRRSSQVNCSYNPKFCNGRGGWFCTDHILVKYGFDFENYIDMRQKAETAYTENGKAEQAKHEKEAEEKRKREWQEAADRMRAWEKRTV